ncbi:hypothetical protein A3SI_16115 [Nitritalea halalkaliphila LW7]|uniref:Uncharacterized protein n=1 Tax=Nitritalea halalkaliphila LW7 TaxID=1189621 RepID=I5BXU8_9BACT|nr:hypothetical protein [Nitritalea halalkaliphila]EIM74400.1 hypothetical protein A3SI_16115 [Nitritalea halalkaliphila LW7]
MYEKYYLHSWKIGSGKTFLSDEIEAKWLNNKGFDVIAVTDANLEEVLLKLNSFSNSLLVIQSNKLRPEDFKKLKKFIGDENFHRSVIIQSEFEPNYNCIKYCDQIYETGYPHFYWVAKIGEEWTAKRINSDEIFTSNTKINAIEFAKRYR